MPSAAKFLKVFVENRFLEAAGHALRVKIDTDLGSLARKILYRKRDVVNNRVMMMTFQGEYTCNEKYITEELLTRGNTEIVWALSKQALESLSGVPEGVKLVEEYTANFYEMVCSSHVLVENGIDFHRYPVKKQAGQKLINTWHGSLGLKRIDRASYKSSKSWLKAADRTGKETDYLISNSTFENNIYRTTYWPETEILMYGHPRNDILLNCSDTKKQELRKKLFEYIGREDKGQKLCLYAPTFRDNHSFSTYYFDREAAAAALKERFGGEWIFLLRYHPMIKRYAHDGKGTSLTADVTFYPEMQELMVLSDAGITDYSSWICDFLLMKKPAFLYFTDYDSYNTERGFAYPLDTTPFSLSRNSAELSLNLRTFDENFYLKKTEAFLTDKGCMEDGHAAERTADLIERLIAGKE